jgi:hypothetical protein
MITIWFDNVPQAQDWQLKLRKEHWTVSDIAAKKSKKYTIEVKMDDDNSAIVFYTLYPELQNNTV